jgi:hypothetical protein
MMKRRRYVHTLFLYTMLLVGFVHALCLYTNVYVMCVHTSFPDPQTAPPKSRRNRGGKASQKKLLAKIERDEDSEVAELEVANKAVCTLFLYTIVLVGRVCTQYTRCVCTQLCTSCLYTMSQTLPGAGQRKQPITKKLKPQTADVLKKAVCTHIAFVHKCVRHVCTHFLYLPTGPPA